MKYTATFIGSGDAFGSGGRLQPCILVQGEGMCFTLDFGLTALIGLRRLDLDPNTIDAVLLTHLHGDHCGGIAFLLMDAMLGLKRETPFTILGPEGTQSHLENLHEALFPGSNVMTPKFPLKYIEISPDETVELSGLSVRAAAARHTIQTNPLAFRVQMGDNKSLAYTGDGEYTQELAGLVYGADLLIAECYYFSRSIKWHLNYPDISRLAAKKTVLTHMHSDMLKHVDEVSEICAYDGLEVEF